jgi:hypothetical protein
LPASAKQLLNWRRDPGLERKIEESRMREQQLKQLNAFLALLAEQALLDQLGPE